MSDLDDLAVDTGRRTSRSPRSRSPRDAPALRSPRDRSRDRSADGGRDRDRDRSRDRGGSRRGRSADRGGGSGGRRGNGDKISLYVNHLSYHTTEQDLRDVFEKYGRILDVYLPRHYETRRPKGFGYIEFDDLADAEHALEKCDRTMLHGMEMRIEFAKGSRKSPREMRAKETSGPPHRRSRSPRRRRYSRSRSRSRRRDSYRDDRDYRRDDRRRSRSRRRSPTPERRR